MESVAPGHQYLHSLPDGKIIRIYHEYKCKIEYSIQRIAVWHHEARPVMTNGDPEGQIFYSTLTQIMDYFFLLTTVFIYLFSLKLDQLIEDDE